MAKQGDLSDNSTPFRRIADMLKSNIYKNVNEGIYTDIDVDDKLLYAKVLADLKEHKIEVYCIIETRGGYHVILENDKLKRKQ